MAMSMEMKEKNNHRFADYMHAAKEGTTQIGDLIKDIRSLTDEVERQLENTTLYQYTPDEDMLQIKTTLDKIQEKLNEADTQRYHFGLRHEWFEKTLLYPDLPKLEYYYHGLGHFITSHVDHMKTLMESSDAHRKEMEKLLEKYFTKIVKCIGLKEDTDMLVIWETLSRLDDDQNDIKNLNDSLTKFNKSFMGVINFRKKLERLEKERLAKEENPNTRACTCTCV